jgi:hypothetical protein
MDIDLPEVAEMVPAFERYGRLSSQTTSARSMRSCAHQCARHLRDLQALR